MNECAEGFLPIAIMGNTVLVVFFGNSYALTLKIMHIKLLQLPRFKTSLMIWPDLQ